MWVRFRWGRVTKGGTLTGTGVVVIVNRIIEKYTLLQAKILGAKTSPCSFIPLNVVAIVSEISGLVLRIREVVVTYYSLPSEPRSPHMVAVIVVMRPATCGTVITAQIRYHIVARIINDDTIRGVLSPYYVGLNEV